MFETQLLGKPIAIEGKNREIRLVHHDDDVETKTPFTNEIIRSRTINLDK